MIDRRPRLHAEIQHTQPGLLNLPITSLPALPQADQRSLDRWLTAARVLTVGDLLTVPCSAEKLCGLAEAWARSAMDAEVELPPAAHARAMSVTLANFEAWAVEHSVADMLRKPISSILTPASLADVRAEYGKIPTLREVLHFGSSPVAARADLAALVMDVLEQEVDERAPALERERAQEALHSVPPEPPLLRGWWTRLRAERAKLRAGVGPPSNDVPFVWSISSNHDRLTVRAGVFADRSSLDIAVRPWAAVPFMHALRHWEPAALVALLDSVLDLITGVAHAPVREALLRSLENPTWHRDLLAFDRILRPAVQRLPDERLGWRVRGDDASGWVISPLWVKGPHRGVYSTRPVADLTEAELCAEEPGDLAALALGTVRDGRNVADHAALDHLVGHPRVFTDARPGEPFDVVRADLVLHLDREAEGDLRFLPRVDGEPVAEVVLRARKSASAWPGSIALWRGPARLVLARAPFRAVSMLSALLSRFPTLPADARSAVLLRVPALRGFLPVVVEGGLEAPLAQANRESAPEANDELNRQVVVENLGNSETHARSTRQGRPKPPVG